MEIQVEENVYKSRGMPGGIAVGALWLEHKLYGCMRPWWCGQLIQQHLLKRSERCLRYLECVLKAGGEPQVSEQ